MLQKPKIKLILIFWALALCVVSPVCAAADGRATVTVGSTATAVSPGKSITVPVTITANPGIAAYSLTISYDSDNLTLNSISNTDNDSNTTDLCSSGLFDSNTVDGTAYITWINNDYNADINGDGDLFYLSFTVKQKAAAGNYQISCALTNGAASSFINYVEESIAVSFTAGTIKVSASTGGGGGGDGSGSGETETTDTTETNETTGPPELTNADHFNDVSRGYWAYDYIEYMSSLDLVNGKSSDLYCPTDYITRAEFITILARMSGDTLPAYNGKFAEVSANDYYAQAVTWAVAANITNGTSATNFSPDSDITREDMATMIYRYAVYMGYSFGTVNTEVDFLDQGDIDDYAAAAVSAMQQADIINGYSNGSFNPLGYANRAEAAKMLALLYQAMNSDV